MKLGDLRTPNRVGRTFCPTRGWAHRLCSVGVGVAVGCVPSLVLGQGFTLVDVGPEVGVPRGEYFAPPVMTAGIAAVDVDGDGWIDFFVPCAEGKPDLLYMNNGDGTFTEMARELGVSGMERGDKPRSRVPLFFDFDGDRRLDLLVIGDSSMTGIADIRYDWTFPRLYRQLPNGRFEDVSEAVGLADLDLVSDHAALLPGSGATLYPRHLGSVAAGDLNGDGYLDLVIGLWQSVGTNHPKEIGARVLLNVPDPETGGRRFEDVTIATLAPGVPDPGVSRFGSFWQIVIHDFDGDGLMDIYGVCDMGPNRLWLNRGTFEEPSRPGVRLLRPMPNAAAAAGMTGMDRPFMPEPDMGVALGDCNNNGLLDVYITKIDVPGSPTHNDLLVCQTRSPLLYANRAVEAGVMGSRFGFGWGTTFQDLDNDGWIDLLVTNGFTECSDRPVLMMNRTSAEGVRFVEHPVPDFNRIERGATVIGADLDRDGHVDILHTIMMTAESSCTESIVQVLRNVPECGSDCNPWIVIQPRMAGPNYFAIGAVVRVRVERASDTLSMMRLLTAGISMAGQEPAEAHFGLGRGTLPTDRLVITIEWPNGSSPTMIEGTVGDLAGAVHTVGPCSVMDIDGEHGVLNFFDLLAFLNAFQAGNMLVADLAEPYGVLDYADLLEAIELVRRGCP